MKKIEIIRIIGFLAVILFIFGWAIGYYYVYKKLFYTWAIYILAFCGVIIPIIIALSIGYLGGVKWKEEIQEERYAALKIPHFIIIITPYFVLLGMALIFMDFFWMIFSALISLMLVDFISFVLFRKYFAKKLPNNHKEKFHVLLMIVSVMVIFCITVIIL